MSGKSVKKGPIGWLSPTDRLARELVKARRAVEIAEEDGRRPSAALLARLERIKARLAEATKAGGETETRASGA